MILTLEIPESVAGGQNPQAFGREVLEVYAAESYRRGKLSMLQVRQLLGHESRWDTQKFLADRDAWSCQSADEIIADAATATRFRSQRE